MSEKKKISSYPVLLTEWDWEKNNAQGIHPDDISIGSTIKVHWKCSLGHQWQATPNNRSRGQGCPICAGRKVEIGFNDLASKYPNIANSWHPTKNEDLLPTQVTSGSHKKVWWICEKGHSYQATIANRYYGKNCPYCANVKVLKGYNDLASQFPAIAEEWDYSKNSETPDNVLPGSNKKVWWKCKVCGHEWMANPNHRVYRHSGCPACSGRVSTPTENLSISNPELCKEWNKNRNSKKPSEYRPHSNQKVWWICSVCGYEWEAKISDRSNGTGCPMCAKKRTQK